MSESNVSGPSDEQKASKKCDTEVQTQSNPPIVSPWLDLENEKNVENINRDGINRHIPLRSVSTIPFDNKGTFAPTRAAPFPSIPSRREVQAVKVEIEQEIMRLHADLSSLQNERKSVGKPQKNDTNKQTADGIKEYRGLIIAENAINAIIAENKAKKEKADRIKNLTNDIQIFHNPVEFPQYQKMIESQRNSVLPLFAAQFAEKKSIMETQKELAKQYVRLKDIWEEPNRLIDEYGDRVDIKSEQWPPEFPTENPIIDDAARLKWCAPDRTMFLSQNQKISDCFYNKNGLVTDPVAAHDEYRSRLVWTDEEKRIFVEKYRQYPKKFSKICAALPEKCHKDVIEFYYLKKYELNLKDNEAALKKRGGRRRVISEGSAKKNY